ncbi:unnamed protein product [Rotaria sordida]|uniref:Uncharacterized protein n=1 Tax=Rotaria sordida TaxID=392033 RepID=A0A814WH57_9BILA|nr:unnamed protein product [Rotaria sordida]
MSGLLGCGKVFLNKVSNIIPNIPENATWKFKAKTVAGGDRRGATLERLHCPRGLFVDKNQNVFVADSLNNRIMKFIRSTTIARTIAGKNISKYGSDFLCKPSNVIYDYKSKSFIISDYYNRRVLRWFPKRGTCPETIIRGSEYYGLAMDDEGFLYVSDPERHEVRRYRSDGRRGKVVAGGNGQGSHHNQLNHPTYIFVGPDGAVYVSDTWNDRVVKWDKNATSGIVVAGGHGKGKDRTQLHYPTGLVVDQLGTVYVADYWNHRVMQWCKGASHGKMIAGSRFLAGNKANQLNGPEGLAFDRSGNLYVVDSNNHRIQRFLIQTV